MKIAVQVAAAMGFLGVALGAFGAHKLEEILSFKQMEIWQTAVLYQLIHSVAALWAAERKPLVVWLWAAGVLLFSGSLYVLTLTGITKLGMITPLGGLLFLAGWLALVMKPPLRRIN